MCMCDMMFCLGHSINCSHWLPLKAESILLMIKHGQRSLNHMFVLLLMNTAKYANTIRAIGCRARQSSKKASLTWIGQRWIRLADEWSSGVVSKMAIPTNKRFVASKAEVWYSARNPSVIKRSSSGS